MAVYNYYNQRMYEKARPERIIDGRKRVETYAENERDRVRNEKLKKKIKEFIFGKGRE